MYYIEDLGKFVGQSITLKGWVANKRTGKGLAFVVLRDGSGFCQCVISQDQVDENSFETANNLNLENSIEVTGTIVKDERQMGGYEMQAESVTLLHKGPEYPIAKKEHGVEFLADQRHLWLRSKKQWAIMRVRNEIIYSIHRFFQEKGFMKMDAPLLTGNACEGTTELFATDFYGKEAYLSQSGQLYGEAMAMAMGRIYTFGPTFRAEKSKTRRHLSEFWMIEPEMAFYDNNMNMVLIEEFLKFVVNNALKNKKAELEVLERDIEMLEKVNNPFPKIEYKEAVKILRGEQDVNGKTSIQVLEADMEALEGRVAEIDTEIAEREETLKGGNIKKGVRNFNQNKIDGLKNELKEVNEKLENLPQWLASAKNFKDGEDFGGSDETVLTKMFDSPIMVYNWPVGIKAFYMKELETDPNYVKGVDVLAPEGYGEIVGGAERETNEDILKRKIKEHNLPMEEFEWYLDLRRYGSVPHAGFGLGLERMVCWICGIKHIRESIPFPRSYGRLMP